jgi:hypothetical protein
MFNETMLSKDDAIELAHTYSWFIRDTEARNHAGIAIYGSWLLSMQERMGVELVNPRNLKALVESANRNFDVEIENA